MVNKKINKKIDEINKKSIKPLKVRFCPACRSTDVAFVFRVKNIFGLLPRVECFKCGNSGMEFPLLIIKADDLKKKKSKKKGVKKKTEKVKKIRRKDGRR